MLRSHRVHAAWICIACCGGGVLAADAPPAGDAAADDGAKTLTQDSIFASFKQSLKPSEHDVVRGHFDLGNPPNVHRYYCMVDSNTGKRETNAVVGDPVPVAGGMTGIRNSAVSFYRCAEAERQGMLVTTGYVLSEAAARSASPARAPAATAASAPSAAAPAVSPAGAAAPAVTSAPPPGAPPSPTAALAAPPAVIKAGVSPDQIDIAGVRLGMSPDEVRAALKAKKLLDYHESAETLSYLDSAKGGMQPIANGRFVNVISAWTPPPSSATDSLQVDGEYFEVMFTPVPGKERAMAIVHSVGYSPANALRETALESALIKKYGGDASNDLPESPTWRYLRGGTVQFGDPCNRRGTFGGLGALIAPAVPRENVALKRSADDFQAQIERCGAALVTEDHHTANGGALREDRLVTRFTVTAYSPALGFEGATAAAQLVQAAGGTAKRSDAARSQPVNSL